MRETWAKKKLMPILKLSQVTVIVRDQEEALKWYTEVLGFVKREDHSGGDFRFLTVSPEGQADVEIVLHKAQNERQAGRVGRGPMLAFETEDCRKTFRELTERGVIFTSPPEEFHWGVSAVFRDLYGNPFGLVQPAAREGSRDQLQPSVILRSDSDEESRQPD